jgi:hypothetical protein
MIFSFAIYNPFRCIYWVKLNHDTIRGLTYFTLAIFRAVTAMNNIPAKSSSQDLVTPHPQINQKNTPYESYLDS